jgi:hypothetical protein
MELLKYRWPICFILPILINAKGLVHQDQDLRKADPSKRILYGALTRVVAPIL